MASSFLLRSPHLRAAPRAGMAWAGSAARAGLPCGLRQLQASSFASAAGRRRLLVINGKGLDVRGCTEEVRLYFKSSAKLPDYVRHIEKTAAELGVDVEHMQTNDLQECIARLEASTEDAVVINPSGFSMERALVDCIKRLGKPVYEVHYGNYLSKGRTSLVSQVANGIVIGAKLDSYALGMRAAVAALEPSYTEWDYPKPS